jgi:HAD superfamily hydrolase (TIGR01509 family)
MRDHAARVPAAVIFDNDGLTLDTEQAWTRAETALYARHGVTFTIGHKRDMLGTSRSTSAARMERHLGLRGRGGQLVDDLHALVMVELEAGAPPMPGIVELVEALRADGVPLGLASNSPSDFVARALAASGLDGAFDVIVTADRVDRAKPAPDVYLAAARALDADPADCVALEDSETGVAAARAAGMVVIGVPSLPGVTLDGADLVARSVSDRRVWGLLGFARDGRPVP